MLPIRHRPTTTKAGGEAIAAGQFQFISIQTPDDVRDRATSHLARSHAAKQALKKKRKRQQELGDNFRVMTPQDKPRMSAKTGAIAGAVAGTVAGTVALSLLHPAAGKLDPFNTLAVDSSRLQTLLGDHKARLAPEPVFTITEKLTFQSFDAVFRMGLVDPALASAVMLSLAFSVAGDQINRECLGYHDQAISYIRERIGSPAQATSESTLGAILLIAGVEARRGMTSHVQLHMGGVRSLLDLCETEGVRLNGAIKRAIFWQDLNSSVLAGTRRIVDHTTFSELRWTRDAFSPSYFRLPAGFQIRCHLLPLELIEVLEDLNALQCIRDAPLTKKFDVAASAQVNNHAASIQSRLVGLPDLDPVVSCCRLAGYLCSVTLCCKVWCALVIPPHVSSKLLGIIQHTNNDPVWDDHPDLLLWLLYVGGAFALGGAVRDEYAALLRLNNNTRFGGLYDSWSDVVKIMRRFIWSEKAFMSQFQGFHKETCTQAGSNTHTSGLASRVMCNDCKGSLDRVYYEGQLLRA
ncbi:hypothetical protein F5X97DRAFT_295359 [Nemania serpens]|nr:hypothetical protein F5X97DRAFT_295359 [Nemania serpens]